MTILFGYALTTIFGLLISLTFVKRMHVIARIGLSYVVGLGLQTYVMFIGNLVGIPYALNPTLLFLFSAVCIMLLYLKKDLVLYVKEVAKFFINLKLNRYERIIFVILVFMSVFSLVCTLYWPVGIWDSLVLYDWRARLFFVNGNMTDAISRGYFFGVPLLTSLAHSWVYMLGGRQPEFIYTLFFISLILMYYGALREFSSRIVSFIFVGLLVISPEIYSHSTFSYTNLPYSVYFIISTIYLYIGITKKVSGYFVLSSILLGLSAWTRTAEPFWMINLLVVIIYYLINKKYLRSLLYVLTFFIIRQPWILFEKDMINYNNSVVSRITEGVEVLTNQFSIDHIILVAGFLYDSVFSNLSIYVLVFVIVSVWNFKTLLKQKNYWLVIMITGYIGLLVVGTYVFSLTFRDWKIGGSAARMVMFIPPLVVFFVATLPKINNMFTGWITKIKD